MARLESRSNDQGSDEKMFLNKNKKVRCDKEAKCIIPTTSGLN
jgi:hypothetical protein